MRAALRLLAQPARYLDAGTPTGLTGLFTHANPRSALLYTYNSTLDKLKKFPEHSVYRQSTEALTKHRLSVIESVKPEGLEQWQDRVERIVNAHPEAFKKIGNNVVYKSFAAEGMKTDEYDDEPIQKPQLEGIRTVAERAGQAEGFMRDVRAENARIPRIEPEPPLSAEQINDIEAQIGGGLIEEIIQIAEGESRLVDVMYENKVWDELEEKPAPGQWEYHERNVHTQTQAH